VLVYVEPLISTCPSSSTVTRVETTGVVKLKLNVMTKGAPARNLPPRLHASRTCMLWLHLKASI
jgi:hypothetical protein